MNSKEAARKAADHFIQNESQFHLGFLPTEQSHPKTARLSQITGDSAKDGIRTLFEADRDILKKFSERLESPEFKKLENAFVLAVRENRKISFSGCGSTGRLALLLESVWRRFWTEARDKGLKSDQYTFTADNVRGIITGGDRALIRSAENFEDYPQLGAEQARELELTRGDVLIAMSEGGETSSVIGTAFQALHDGCQVFFVFNNPAELLCQNIERSRILIEHPEVTVLDLHSGPMALSGSTRMQATSSEFLYISIAMENAVCRIIGEEGCTQLGLVKRTGPQWQTQIQSLLDDLSAEQNLETCAEIVTRECAQYSKGKMIAYSAERYLNDVFADTTERTPTFSLPGFLPVTVPGQTLEDGPRPWAIAYHPKLITADAWKDMLGRPPRGLYWSAPDYYRLGAVEFANHPPVLDDSAIQRYPIGTEVPELYEPHIGEIIAVSLPGFSDHSGDFIIGGLKLNVDFEKTGLDVFEHLALKLIINAVSTAGMARMGRIRGNWMIQVTPGNKKLIDRSIRIISALLEIPYKEAAIEVFSELNQEKTDKSSLVTNILERHQAVSEYSD